MSFPIFFLIVGTIAAVILLVGWALHLAQAKADVDAVLERHQRDRERIPHQRKHLHKKRAHI